VREGGRGRGHSLVGRLGARCPMGQGKKEKIEINFEFDFQFLKKDYAESSGRINWEKFPKHCRKFRNARIGTCVNFGAQEFEEGNF
jgi:hypothetical protein